MKRLVLQTKAIAISVVLSHLAVALDSPAQSPALTITNPTPAIADQFGQAVAVVGDCLLVGDPQDSTADQYTGAAYLYNSTGALMRTFLNPAPANGYFFGRALAAVGNDKVLIGAPFGNVPVGATHPGGAYLFHTNGTLIRTFLRPPGQAMARFGTSVAALGTDRVLIGADGDDRAGTDAGAAYLFGTNGTLLATLTNPAPVDFEALGTALAVVGQDRILIGAPANPSAPTTPGSAFLFNTNGTMLTKFDNPIPASGGSFGWTVAALGTDLVAIGAPFANIMAPRGGEVYLFRTNGVLFGPALGNPDAAEHDNFGKALAAVGPDKLLVSSFNQAHAQNAGAVYLFSTNGTRLLTIRMPSTNDAPFFGSALVAITTDRVLIGTPEADWAGAAFVYDLRPSLTIFKTAANSVRVSWLSAWNDWTLEQNTNANTSTWSPVSESLNDDSVNRSIIVGQPVGNRYYRLFKP
ncbi:MAG: FG-GAP repeat protein [Verrucomicrobia bacterium]|nr:FG-GAP repeat protein [Verrucomicrobiota bacterium]